MRWEWLDRSQVPPSRGHLILHQAWQRFGSITQILLRQVLVSVSLFRTPLRTHAPPRVHEQNAKGHGHVKTGNDGILRGGVRAFLAMELGGFQDAYLQYADRGSLCHHQSFESVLISVDP